MAVINGGLVQGISHSDIYELVPDKMHRRLLINHRNKKFRYFADRMISENKDLQDVLFYVRDNVSENWFKTLRGTLTSFVLLRFMYFQINPQWYQYRMDLVFYASYVYLQKQLQRTAKVLIECYGLEDKFYNFHFTKKQLYYFSELLADKMFDTSKDMVKHLDKLQSKATKN